MPYAESSGWVAIQLFARICGPQGDLYMHVPLWSDSMGVRSTQARHAAGSEELSVLGKEALGPKEHWVDTAAASLLSHQVGEDFLQSFEIVGPVSMDV